MSRPLTFIIITHNVTKSFNQGCDDHYHPTHTAYAAANKLMLAAASDGKEMLIGQPL